MSGLSPFHASRLSLFLLQANLYFYKVLLQPFSLPCKEGTEQINKTEEKLDKFGDNLQLQLA